MSDAEDDVYATDLEDEPEEFEDEVGGEGNRVDGGAAGAVLEFVARSIVDEPDAVVVEHERDRRGTMLRLHVAPDDMGKVIGRRGRVAQAIRSVVRATAAREGTEVNVDIVD
ncbi:MAG: uncharacterized protein QOF60_296 [Actinomycetota bacterium]|nr:uncharacterized protein [Actinomycetota bacterium]